MKTTSPIDRAPLILGRWVACSRCGVAHGHTPFGRVITWLYRSSRLQSTPAALIWPTLCFTCVADVLKYIGRACTTQSNRCQRCNEGVARPDQWSIIDGRVVERRWLCQACVTGLLYRSGRPFSEQESLLQ
jgi:hypothetical protein